MVRPPFSRGGELRDGPATGKLNGVNEADEEELGIDAPVGTGVTAGVRKGLCVETMG